jgi:uncharacterized membrane protein YgaE (UPF0421/DUF939 family)
MLHLDNPWWAGITGFALIQHDARATFLRSIDRATGTIVGAVIGYFTAGAIADHLTFQVLVASCAAFSIYGQERTEHGYAVLLVGVTVILVLFGSLAEPGQALRLSVYRTLEILVGIAVTCLVDYGLAAPDAGVPAAAAKPGIWSLPVDLELPGLGQTPITAFIILTSLRHEPFWKALTRVCGCVLGAVYGLGMMHFIGDTFLPWLIALFIGLFICGHIFRSGGDIAYVGMQAGFPCRPLVTPLIQWAIRLVLSRR